MDNFKQEVKKAVKDLPHGETIKKIQEMRREHLNHLRFSQLNYIQVLHESRTKRPVLNIEDFENEVNEKVEKGKGKKEDALTGEIKRLEEEVRLISNRVAVKIEDLEEEEVEGEGYNDESINGHLRNIKKELEKVEVYREKEEKMEEERTKKRLVKPKRDFSVSLTVPKPFSFEGRRSTNLIKKKNMDEFLDSRKRELENYKRGFKAKPVPSFEKYGTKKVENRKKRGKFNVIRKKKKEKDKKGKGQRNGKKHDKNGGSEKQEEKESKQGNGKLKGEEDESEVKGDLDFKVNVEPKKKITPKKKKRKRRIVKKKVSVEEWKGVSEEDVPKASRSLMFDDIMRNNEIRRFKRIKERRKWLNSISKLPPRMDEWEREKKKKEEIEKANEERNKEYKKSIRKRKKRRSSEEYQLNIKESIPNFPAHHKSFKKKLDKAKKAATKTKSNPFRFTGRPPEKTLEKVIYNMEVDKETSKERRWPHLGKQTKDRSIGKDVPLTCLIDTRTVSELRLTRAMKLRNELVNKEIEDRERKKTMRETTLKEIKKKRRDAGKNLEVQKMTKRLYYEEMERIKKKKKKENPLYRKPKKRTPIKRPGASFFDYREKLRNDIKSEITNILKKNNLNERVIVDIVDV